jgi:Uma2 family endonuclease
VAISARVILTYDDYAALPDDGRRCELYEGELVMTPSPRTRHQVVVGNLGFSVVTERAIEGAPTLVVEVLSPSTDARDRGVKQALYARYGVPYYWIVEPEPRTIHGLGLGAGSYEVIAGLDATRSAALPPLAGLTLDPSAVWR